MKLLPGFGLEPSWVADFWKTPRKMGEVRAQNGELNTKATPDSHAQLRLNNKNQQKKNKWTSIKTGTESIIKPAIQWPVGTK